MKRKPIPQALLKKMVEIAVNGPHRSEIKTLAFRAHFARITGRDDYAGYLEREIVDKILV